MPLRAAPSLTALFLIALAFLLIATAGADARRRYYRHRVSEYSPAGSAMVLDLYSGRTLYSRNASELRYPASITKVMTLYLLFDAMRDGKIGMNTQLRVSAHAAAQSPTKLDLSEGDKISVANAIGAIVTKSANDMAVTIAEALAGSEEEFARRMTQKARSIGMLNTTFRNASGLPNSEQTTTANDLITLGRSILFEHPERCKIFATRYFQYGGEGYRNHNTMLYTYEGMEGMKTGFTQASGFNLLATARRGDRRLLAVVLGGASAGARNATMRALLDNSWPKAMTITAARKTGVLTTALKPNSPGEAKAQPKAPEPAEPKPAKSAAGVAVKPAPAPAASTSSATLTVLTFPSAYSRLKRKPDRTSAAMLFYAMEAGLVMKPALASYSQPAASPDSTTDEPEDKAAQEDGGAPSFEAPPANEILRNETIAAMTPPPQQNVTVYNKSERPPEIQPLAAAALDAPALEPAPVKVAQAAPAARRAATAHAPQTLAATTAPAPALQPEQPAQPGPFHVQAGAFPDEAQAKERLERVREALGAAFMKTHPEFIMRITRGDGTTMYRARLGRFVSAAQASDACKRLKQKAIPCWDLPVD